MKFERKKLLRDVGILKRPIILMGIYCIVCELIFHKICISRILTGMPCPGCGLTRAFQLAATGHFAEATRMHPLWIFLVIAVPVALLERYLKLPIKISERIKKGNQVILFVVLISFLIFYVYRMSYEFPNHPPMMYDHQNLREYLTLHLSCQFYKIVL